MHISVPVNHNYYERYPIIGDVELRNKFKSSIGPVRKLFSDYTEITTNTEQYKQIKVIGFKPQISDSDDEKKLILRLYKKGNQHFVQTGLYAGILFHEDCKFEITSGYSKEFLHRMLSFANDIFVDIDYHKATKKKGTNEFEYILGFLMNQALEKASVLGLPKKYMNQKIIGKTVKGRVNIKEFINKSIPFRGEIPTIIRSREFIPEINDVIYFALRKLKEKNITLSKSVLNTMSALKQAYSGKKPDQETLKKAKEHPIFSNPLFKDYKRVIDYAEIIINDYKLDLKSDAKSETTGYLFDISQLFEVYLEKLLRRNLDDWTVSGQYEIHTYQKKFYQRRMFPDLVLRNNKTNKIAVFDAKYKKMEGIKIDLDRSDFFQIHSYMYYFNKDLIAGGLLYPISWSGDEDKGTSNFLFGEENQSNIQFLVDGINMNLNEDKDKLEQIIDSEKEFIERMKHRLITLIS